MPERNVIKIAVNARAKGVIEKAAEELGMKEFSVASRIYEWFSEQDPVVQRGVLRLLPPGYEGSIAEMALQRMKADAEKKPAKGK